jgi:hypothetical protein
MGCETMKDDMIDDFIKIMDHVWEKDGDPVCTEEHLKTKFGDKLYEKFKRFAMDRGQEQAYVAQHMIKNVRVIRLTGIGMGKLVDLKKTQADKELREEVYQLSKRQGEENKRIQLVLVLLTAIIAFSSIFVPFYENAEGIPKMIISSLFLIFAIGIYIIGRKINSDNFENKK